jgi:hypothetical protein
MDKDEKKEFRRGVLSGVIGNAIWQTIWGLLFGGAMLGAAAAWYRGLNDIERGGLYMLSALLLLSAAIIPARICYRTWRQKRSAQRGLVETQAADTMRELERIRAIARRLPPGEFKVLSEIASEGPQSVLSPDLNLLNLFYCNLVESLGKSTIGEQVIALHPAYKAAIIEYFAHLETESVGR